MDTNSKSPLRLLASALFVLAIVAGYFASQWLRRSGRHTLNVVSWIRNSEAHPDWIIPARSRCQSAPFFMPTQGFIGFLWDDSFRPGHRHQGIDIFSGAEPGVTPVFAAHAGYLTRLPDWKSSLIIRIPDDPLQAGRQIWTYYTHMAESEGKSSIVVDFPPGSWEVYVEAGTLLGYQGDYSGDPNNPVGVHLHFSIVLDDGYGNFRNELEIGNTLDPSPYLGMALNAKTNKGEVPECKSIEQSATGR